MDWHSIQEGEEIHYMRTYISYISPQIYRGSCIAICNFSEKEKISIDDKNNSSH